MVNAKGHSFAVKKLRRKILAVFQQQYGNSTLLQEQCLVKFNNVIKKMPGVEVQRNQAKLKTVS
ncbi:hypothetical protein B566_EDAN005127 [Ephemera danica]|nr:hypothetical protein B566_EDAN005127 [Ephemera danica]